MPNPVFNVENPKREPKQKKNILSERSSPSPPNNASTDDDIMLVPYVGIR